MREALRALAGKLEELAGPDDVRLFDVPGAPRPDEDTPAPPRLMAMWDSTLIAYTDRSRLMPPEYRPHVIRRNGDVLVDGYVAGVWRPVEEGIAVTAFCRVPDEAWGALAGRGRRSDDLPGRPGPGAVPPYGHWWSSLATTEVRLIAGIKDG